MGTTEIIARPTESAQKLLDVMQRMLTSESRAEVLEQIDRDGFDIHDPSTYGIAGIDVEKALAQAARLRGGHWVQDATYAGGYRWVADKPEGPGGP